MLLENLLDLPSAAFILAPLFGAFVASRFTQHGIKLANGVILQAGLVGTLIGLVTMLGNLSDPEAIGPGLSIAFLTILYALVASAVFTLASLKLTLEPTIFWSRYSLIAVSLWMAINFWAMMLGSGITAFVSIPAIIFVALSILVIITVGGNNRSGSLLLCAEYLPYAGLIGFLIGIILILQNLSDPRLIGPAMAFSFLTLFYTNWIPVAIKLGLANAGQEYKSSSWQYLSFTVLSLALILFFIWSP